MPKGKVKTIVCKNCSFLDICDGKYLGAEEICRVAALTSLQVLVPIPDTVSVCPVCLGVERVLRSGVWRPCVCLHIKKARAYLSPLKLNASAVNAWQVGKIEDIDIIKNKIKNKIKNETRNVTPKSITDNTVPVNILLQSLPHTYDVDRVKSILAYCLLLGGISRSYELFSLFDLTRIVLGEEIQGISSLKGLKKGVLLLTVGREEIPNKFYPCVLQEVLNLYAWEKRLVYIYSFGKLIKKYPTVTLSGEWVVIDLAGDGTGPKPRGGGAKRAIVHNIQQADAEDIL